MKFSWQQQILLTVSAALTSTPSPAVASYLMTPTPAMKHVAFTRKSSRYNPLTRISAGGDDSVTPENQGVNESPASDPTPDVLLETAVPNTSLLGPNATPPGFFRSKFPSLPWHKLPDYLTYARCIAVPAFVAFFYANMKGKSHLYTGSIFALASVTDWLDGFLARRWDISTAFGAFLDPVADKLMVSTSLILLAGRYGAIAAIPTLIILAREIAISALREWMAQRGERDTVKVGYQGKVKTALTMLSLTILLYVPASAPTSAILYKIGIPLLYMSAVITITSGSVYFIAAAPALLNKK